MLSGIERLPDCIDAFETCLAQSHHERLTHGCHFAVALRCGRVAPVEHWQQRFDQTTDSSRHLLASLCFDPSSEVLKLRSLALQLIQIVVAVSRHGLELGGQFGGLRIDARGLVGNVIVRHLVLAAVKMRRGLVGGRSRLGR